MTSTETSPARQTYVALITIEKTCRLTIRAWTCCRSWERIVHFPYIHVVLCIFCILIYFKYKLTLVVFERWVLFWRYMQDYTSQFTMCVSLSCSNFKMFLSSVSFRSLPAAWKWAPHARKSLRFCKFIYMIWISIIFVNLLCVGFSL